MTDTKAKFQTVDEYIASFPPDTRKSLELIRQTIRNAAPEAVEVISYNIPAFKLKGRDLVYFSAWKAHYSVYPFSSAMEEEIRDALKYKTSGKGTIQFPKDEPLPLELITKIVEFRIKDKEAGKRKTKS